MNSPLRSSAHLEHAAAIVPEPPAPRVFYPGSWRAANSPASWVWDHLPRIHAALHERGAVLLRGFELNDIEPFVKVSTLVGGPLGHVVAHVRDAVNAEAIPVAWQRGDLMIVDNHLALHGRRPYRGARSVAVAWSKARAA